nr:immunoglobulin heavy chain junction region [Macaca mulatta]
CVKWALHSYGYKYW